MAKTTTTVSQSDFQKIDLNELERMYKQSYWPNRGVSLLKRTIEGLRNMVKPRKKSNEPIILVFRDPD
jgi:hypothetical protein